MNYVPSNDEIRIKTTLGAIDMFWSDLDVAIQENNRGYAAHVCRCLDKLYREIGAY